MIFKFYIKYLAVFLFAISPFVFFSQSKKTKFLEKTIKLKKSDILNKYSIKSIIYEIPKKCTVDGYIIYLKNSQIKRLWGTIDEEDTKRLGFLKVGEKFNIRIIHSGCTELNDKVYTIEIVN